MLDKQQKGQVTDNDLRNLRETMKIAEESRAAGNHPFGALLAGPDGAVLITSGNTFKDDKGVGHAEMNVARAAAKAYAPEFLAECTLVTSVEPCCMCAGAVYWTGIGRVVYALSEHALLGLTGDHPENPTFSLPCREVFARGQRAVAVLGPLLEDEAVAPHRGFWDHGAQHE